MAEATAASAPTAEVPASASATTCAPHATEERKDGDVTMPPRSRSRSRSRDRDARSRSSSRRRSSKHRSSRHHRSSGSRRDRSRSRSRDRDRDRRHRRRRSRSYSRSRSRDRDRDRDRHYRRRSYSRSRSRSPRRDRGATGSKFDRGAIASVLSGVTAASVPISLVVNAVDPQQTRPARRLYIGNLPVQLGLTALQITEFLTTTLVTLGITTPNPIVETWLSTEGTYCFPEFRSVVDCSFALQLLQGLQMGGRVLRINRPQDYKQPPPHLQNYVVGQPLGIPAPLPTFATNAPFMQLLAAGQSPFLNPTMMLLLQDPTLAAAANTAVAAPPAPAPAVASTAAAPSTTATATPSPVILLENMVSPEELIDDKEFRDLHRDISEEVEKFGKLLKVVIPRPLAASGAGTNEMEEEGPRVREGEGTGRIFVQYAEQQAAIEARAKLHGRGFAGKSIAASYYPVEKLEAKIFI